MDQVDWSMIKDWKENGPKLAPGVTIETFVEVPKKDIMEYCALYTACINLVPKGEEEWEVVITPETRRDYEKKNMDKGNIWVTKLTREPNGSISGLTELIFNPENPHLAHQELTAVLPEYRGKGLGKWLKAEMILEFREKYPTIRYIATGNADVNAPMLSINSKMGFKPHREWVSYKVTAEEMKEFVTR